jgi:hypothetical protein
VKSRKRGKEGVLWHEMESRKRGKEAQEAETRRGNYERKTERTKRGSSLDESRRQCGPELSVVGKQ